MLGVYLYSGPVITLLTSNVVLFLFVAFPWIDDDLRFYSLLDAIFVGLVPVAMQVLVAMYTLHGGAIGSTAPVLGHTLSFYQFSSVVAFLCFLLLALRPYVIGVLLSRRMGAALLTANERLTITAVEGALNAFWRKNVGDLDVVLAELARERDGLANRYPSIERINALGGEDAPATAEELRVFRNGDLRLRVFDRMSDHIAKLEHVKALASRGVMGEALQALQHIGSDLTYRLIRIEDELQQVRTARPAMFASLVLLGSALVSAILSLAARLLVGQVVGLA